MVMQRKAAKNFYFKALGIEILSIIFSLNCCKIPFIEINLNQLFKEDLY